MAKVSSGATEINGFIAVKNEKKDTKKTSPGKTNPVGSKDESKTKKPAVSSERSIKNNTTTSVGNVRKQLTKQNETDKNKVITKKSTENKVPIKPQVPAASTKKVPETKSTTSLSNNKPRIQTTKQVQEKLSNNQKTLQKNPVKSEQKKATNVADKKPINAEQRKSTFIEQKKQTNVYKPNRPTNNVEQKRTTNIEQKKNVDPKLSIKSKPTIEKDVRTQYKIPPRLNQNVKSNSQVLKDNQQKKTTKSLSVSTAKTNNNNKVVDSASNKSGKSTKQNVKEVTSESTNESKKDDEIPKPSIVSRQGTWIKETSDKKNTDNANIDYESDFEAETSISTSERTDAASKSQSLSQKVRKSNLQTNKSRLASSQGKDVSEQNELKNGEESNVTIVDDNMPKLETFEKRDNFERSDETGKADEEITNSIIPERDFPQSNEEHLDKQYDYDDDFEDYESDFEEYTESGLSVSSSEDSDTSNSPENDTDSFNDIETKTSKLESNSKVRVEEEKKLDSGNYDLTTKVVLSEAVKQRQLHEIKEAISRENSIYQERNFAADESEKDSDESVTKLKIMNFKEAYQKSEIKKNRERVKQRGEQILSMITLHSVQYNLFEMAPIPYDTFIKIYGRLNFVQANTQTGEDSQQEETQTEEINLENKWTQHPVEFHRWTNDGNDVNIYLEDRQGVGGDKINNHTKWLSNSKYNVNKLSSFIHYAGQIMLISLEEEEQESNLPLKRTKQSYGFSDGYVQISVDNINFLKDRSVTDIVFSPHNPNTIMTSHRAAKETGDTFVDQYYARSIICVWSILEPSQPLKMLVAPCQISATCFDDTVLNLIYAGLTDGTVCLWDISEPIDVHQQNMFVDMPVLRSPTYCTYDINEDTHLSTVTSIKSIGYGKSASKSGSSMAPSRLISLSEDGKMIVWTVIQLSEPPMMAGKQAMIELGIAYWGRVKLVFASLLNPLKYLKNLSTEQDMSWGIQLLCMVRTMSESVNLLIGSNVGKIVHMHISGTAVQPVPVFKNSSDEQIAITCIELCPHELQLFLAGCDDGTIRMYKIDRKLPLRVYTLQKEVLGEPVTRIKWSIMKPGLFMVMDKDNNIHLYDLCYGDLSPQITVPLKKYRASHLEMTKDKKFSYVAFILKKNILQVHKLKSQFIYKKTLPLHKEFELFNLYIEKLS